jgi:hypothetical protein
MLMPTSKLHVEERVNIRFVDADGRSINHALMHDTQSDFDHRLKQVVRHFGLKHRRQLAIELGVKPDTASQTAQRWVARRKMPDKFHELLARRGISISWLNTGEGEMTTTNSASAGTKMQRSSQSPRLDPSTIVDAMKAMHVIHSDEERPPPDLTKLEDAEEFSRYYARTAEIEDDPLVAALVAEERVRIKRYGGGDGREEGG